MQVNNAALNPGTRDYAVTIRYETTKKFGNIIQKGQAHVSGGYFKLEQPGGFPNCFFTGPKGAGAVKSTVATNDGHWHVIRCERTATQISLYIDSMLNGQITTATGNISNTMPLTIGGKINCDQVTVTCDYFAGDIDYVHIEASSGVVVVVTPPRRRCPASRPVRARDREGSISAGPVPPTSPRRSPTGSTATASTAAIGQTTSTTFTDTGLAAGSTHTYTVDAVDALTNASAKSTPSDPITVASGGAIFSDDFSSGNFSNWTGVTRLTIDSTQGSAGAPSARGNPSATSAFAYKTLGATYPSACMSVNVNLASQPGAAVDLFRLRTAGDGPIARAFVDASGILFVRSDSAGAQKSSG